MKRQREAAFHGQVAHALAEEADLLLPVTEPHRGRVWELAGQLLFPKRGRGLRLIIGGASAAAVLVAWWLPSPVEALWWSDPPEAHRLDNQYRAMRKDIKKAVHDQIMHRVLIYPDGSCHRVLFERRAGDPFVALRVVSPKPEPMDCAKATAQASEVANDG